jgi:starvation-inducible DNA-binding protein
MILWNSIRNLYWGEEIMYNENSKESDVYQCLAQVQADSYLIFLKTQNFHWNVQGPMFFQLHLLFEKQYEEVYEAVDVIAEHIRALGERALGSFREFSQHSDILESSDRLSSEDMIQELALDHEMIIKSLYKTIDVATEADDQATVDLCTERLRAHEKHIWMLRSILA